MNLRSLLTHCRFSTTRKYHAVSMEIAATIWPDIQGRRGQITSAHGQEEKADRDLAHTLLCLLNCNHSNTQKLPNFLQNILAQVSTCSTPSAEVNQNIFLPTSWEYQLVCLEIHNPLCCLPHICVNIHTHVHLVTHAQTSTHTHTWDALDPLSSNSLTKCELLRWVKNST